MEAMAEIMMTPYIKPANIPNEFLPINRTQLITKQEAVHFLEKNVKRKKIK